MGRGLPDTGRRVVRRRPRQLQTAVPPRISLARCEVRALFRAANRAIADLEVGDRLELRRDIDNDHDANAIQVINEIGAADMVVGYLGKEWAAILAPELDRGRRFATTIIEIEPKREGHPRGRIWVRVDLRPPGAL